MRSSALYELSCLHRAVIVGKMPVPREYTLLEVKRIRPRPQHIVIVISLYEHHAAAPESFVHLGSNVPEIGADRAVFIIRGMYPVAAALYGVMRRIEAAKLASAAAYGLSCYVYDMGACSYLVAVAEPLQCTLLPVNGDTRLFREHGKSCNVVGVLMCNKHALHCAQRYVVDFKGVGKPLEAHSAVYEYAALSVPIKVELPLLELKRG